MSETPAPAPSRLRVAYLGPQGTFSEEAVLAGGGGRALEHAPLPTVYDVLMAVHEGAVDAALVPIENSIEGAVNVTLDTLAGEAQDVVIVGELVLAVRHCLIVAAERPLADIELVVSHPQATAQCARFLRSELPRATIQAASSTAEAVRMVAGSPGQPWAALGTPLAARLYGAVVLRDGVQDTHDNETRFVWLARAERRDELLGGPAGAPGGREAAGYRTSVVFWGPGAEAPGWLVDCLNEFARRRVNLTRIESRPRRERLGRYMFFADLEGSVEDPRIAGGLQALRAHCQEVRVLGSYPVAE